jgi:hypothetical protein
VQDHPAGSLQRVTRELQWQGEPQPCRDAVFPETIAHSKYQELMRRPNGLLPPFLNPHGRFSGFNGYFQDGSLPTTVYTSRKNDGLKESIDHQ